MAARRLVTKLSLRMSSRAAFYGHAKTGDFTQVGPTFRNPYKDDPILDRLLTKMLSQKDYDRVATDLDKFGERVTNEIDELGKQAERNPPRLEPMDAWGKRVDNLIVCPEWYTLKKICAEEGIIGIGYEKDIDPETRRIHQIAKLYLFAGSAGLSTCPMAMTDGAVKTLSALGLYGKHELATEAVDRLLSRDGEKAWTSGQWMTEKKGGSDVGGGCDTYAVKDGDKYKLYGYKWFSSAVDADIALTLARIVDKDGNTLDGSKGLSLFILRIRDDQGKLNGIQMMRLKNKLGTKQLPTAELLLDGCEAEILGTVGKGVAGISNMLNITRVHNAVSSISMIRKVISLARDYSTKRVVFGQTQDKWPLHTATLSRMEVETRGSTLLLFEAARLLGLQEAGTSSADQLTLLRLITPVLKLYAGKLSVPLVSEGIECFGGQGYIEDTGLPTLLRDVQVTPIWEGTTNVLSLDVLRVMSGKDNVFKAFSTNITQLIAQLPKDASPKLQQAKEEVGKGLVQLGKILQKAGDSAIRDSIRIDAAARDISFAFARIWEGALLIDFAISSVGTSSDAEVAYRFCCEQPLVNLKEEWLSKERVQEDRDLVFQNFSDYSRTSKL